MTFFGGLLAYVTPARESLGIAFAFLSATAYGYAQYLSIAYIQFGADQVELGIAGGLAGVARYAGGAVAITVYESILVTVQSSHAATGVPAAAEAAGASPAVAKAVLAALLLLFREHFNRVDIVILPTSQTSLHEHSRLGRRWNFDYCGTLMHEYQGFGASMNRDF